MTDEASKLALDLADVLANEQGGPVEVHGVERLKGGYSRHMWAFRAALSGKEPSGWILCTDAEDGVVGADSLTRTSEARLLHHVFQADIPAPAIAASGRGPEPFGSAWFVMRRLPGTAAVGPLLRDPEISALRPTLGRQKAAILARIHQVPVPVGVFESSMLGVEATPTTVARIETSRWERALAQTPSASTDTIGTAVAWLQKNPSPPPERLCIVHGDYRTGNLLYDRTGITGVLDWEMAHPGDPLEDLAWAQLDSWRLGTGLVGALLPDDQWIDAYRQASGRVIDPNGLRFWQVLTGVKMSLLAWRAIERTPPGKEHDLLRVLFDQLQRQLCGNLS